MFSERRPHYWLQQSRKCSTTCIVALLHNSVCCCLSLWCVLGRHDDKTCNLLRCSFCWNILVQSSKNAQKKEIITGYSLAKRIKRHWNVYKMFVSKNDRWKWPARREFDRSSPRSSRTFSVDLPLLSALLIKLKTCIPIYVATDCDSN